MLYWKSYRHLCGVGLLLLLSACGGGGSEKSGVDSTNSGNTSSVTSASSSQSTNTPDTNPQDATTDVERVSIEGHITYDRVPFAGRTYLGLNYDDTVAQPARGVVVQLVDTAGQTLASTVTDAAGHYTLTVSQNTQVQLRVLAELFSRDKSHWQVQVRDNTSGNAQYRLDGSIASSGSASTQTRDLHAPSGWDGSAYSSPRSAGPFAILDSIYDALNALNAARPGLVYPSLSVYWSENNIAISGDPSRGHISTSYYTGAGPSIYILGAQNNDSDEYDRAVVQHEFGHFVEHQLSRTESLGGSHTQNSRLDMRVAFGEAWGNAFAAMVSNDSVYRDSYGASQSLAFGFDVERRAYGTQGWFSEASVQAILFDLFDDYNDGGDTLELGLGPIINVLISDEYLSFNGFASIYPFIESLKRLQPDHAEEIDNLMNNFNIVGSGGYGEGETNNGGSSVVLPLYHAMQLGETVNLCSDSDYNNYNGMDIRRFVRIDIPSRGNYYFNATKTNGLAFSNPQIRVTQRGRQITSLGSSQGNVEAGERTLSAGEYVVEIYEQANVDGNDSNNGLVCFDLTIR